MIISKLKNKNFLFLFFFSYFIVWVSFSYFGNIHPDSMDHWGWAKKLQWVYYEHPPMIAYFMKPTRFFPSHNILLVKLGAVLSTIMVLIAAYFAAKQFLKKEESFLYIILLHSTFYYSLLSQFWFVDQAYNFFLFLCFFSIGKYLNTNNKKWILLLGVFGGLGGMSKYIIIIFFISLVIWLCVSTKYRFLLWNPYMWLAGGLALIIFSPVIYEDFQNNWGAFLFVLNKGIKEEWVISNLFIYQLGHCVFFSIFLSFPAWYFLIKKQKLLFKKNQKKFLLIQIIIPIIIFSYSSMKGRLADPNWVNISYIALYLFLARFFYICIIKKKKFPIYCIVLSHLVIFCFIIFTFLFQNYQFSFVNKLLANRFNETVGWQQISQGVQELFQEKNEVLPEYIITKHYDSGAAISFYLPNNPFYYVTQRPERRLVSKDEIINSKAIILIREHVFDDIEKIQKIFPQDWEYLGNVQALVAGKIIRGFQVWLKQPLLQ